MTQPKLRFKREYGTEFPEWEEKVITEICESILGGGTPTTENEDYWNGDIAWVSSSDLDNNDIHHLSITRFITEEAIRCSATKKVPRDSVLIVSRVGVGKVAVAPCELCTSQDFTNIVKPKCNSLFLGYMLSIIMQTKANGVQGTSIKGIPAKEIKQYRIPIPCLEEQQKIADFLSTVDEVIAQSEAEVQNLEQQKKAAMQKIFTQEVRFSREDGTSYPNWDEYLLQDISFYVTATAVGNKASFVGTENMKKRCMGVLFDTDGNSQVQGVKYQVNDILVSNIRPYLQKAWKADRNGICSTDVLCIRGNNGIDSNFLYDLIANDNFFDYVMQGAKGTKMPRGDKRHIMNMPVALPCLEEQQKIADFLSTNDEAISYAKQELDKWKEIKKGLLQQMFA